MATNNMLKFYRLGAEAMATKTIAVGAIWFNTDDNTIQIKTATGWEKYAGKLNNAVWDENKKKLTISKYDGSSIQLDFSDIASGASVSAALNALEAKLQGNIDGANAAAKAADDKAVAAQADADALEEALGSGFSKDSTVSAQLAAVKATADAAAVKTTVDAELAKKADADQVALDIAAAKKDAEDTAAADATSKANQAKADAIAEAQRLDVLMDARVDVLEAAIGEDGSVADAIKNAIEALDTPEAGVKGDNTHVDVTVKQVNGVITEVVVDESDIASAQALADEIADRSANEEEIVNRIALLDAAETGRVSVLEGKVNALSSATHFLGVKASLPAIAANGDIVIVGNKEYVWDDNEDGTNVLGKAGWIELGDTTAESGRITTLEAWKTEAVQAIADNKTAIESNDVDIKALQDADAAQAELNATLATKQELANEKAALNALIEANGTAITALQVADTTINGRLDGHGTKIGNLETAVAGKVAQGDFNTLKGRVDTAEADIDGVQEDVANLQTGTGLADGASAPVYTDSNYLSKAATMVAADMALDAKIKEVADSVTSKNVSAEGDAYVSATAANNKVTVATVTGTVESKSGLATNQGVYDALCWVEFE